MKTLIKKVCQLFNFLEWLSRERINAMVETGKPFY